MVKKYEEVLPRVKKERNILHTTKRRQANWTGHILRRNCHSKHITERKKGREEKEEGVSSYYTSLRKREETGICNRKH
jgi:hypothetical protein